MPANSPRSFRDPAYDAFDRAAAARVGIPADLLTRIRVRGERTNADQVSPVGARSVYQIMPDTRRLFLKKYGVDAYLGPEQAAHVAALHLRESMDRNGGSARAAVREYHGGPDRSKWGKVNAAYDRRVNDGGGAAPRPTQTTFDRMQARRRAEADQTPSIAKVYEAYRGGRMQADERAEFERDVADGKLVLPRGAAVQARPVVKPTALPESVVTAYSSGQMDEAARGQLDADLRKGIVALPAGAKLERPGAQSVGEGLGIGVRNALTTASVLPDLFATPLNTVLNALPGVGGLSETPFRDVANRVADAIGLSKPETESEKLVQAIAEGGGSALMTAGIAGPVAGLTSAVSRTGTVSRALAANPIRDVISGVTGGAGAYAGEKVGGTPGAIIGGLAGGAGGAVASSLAERLVARVPRSAMLDEAGNVTDNGREVIQRTGANVDEVREAYARVRPDNGPRPPVRPPEEASAARAEASARARTALSDPETQMRFRDRLNAKLVGRDATEPASGPDLPGQSARIVDAIDGRVPPRVPNDAAASPDETAGSRFVEAESEGVQLTRGQAEQDFAVQNDENSLRVAASAEGEEARRFFDQQNEQIKEAAERFRSGFGNLEATPADRGAAVKQAISDLRDAGQEGVTRLYREAEAMGGEGLALEVDGIRQTATDILIDEAVPEPVKRAVSQELARYGLIGEAQPINEAGITKVRLDDGSSVSFRGPVKQLTVANGEDLRKAVNRLYDPTRPNLSGQQLKGAIDDAVEAAVEKAALDAPETGVGSAYRKAREAYREQKQTFSAKDVIQSLIDNKRGTGTPVTLPERAVAAILGSSPNDVTNLRQVKTLLLSGRTPSARNAWRAIQAQGLAGIFEKAVNIQTGQISGARLNTAINKFGVEKLKVLLATEDFNQLMKLRRIVKDATIPMNGTTNPSGTFSKMVNFLKNGVLRFASPIPGVGQAVDAIGALAAKARDLAATRKTLEGITSYDGKQTTARRLDRDAREFVKQYIEDGGAGRLMPTTINLASGPGGTGEQP